jgi:hypothetical protein
MLFCLVYREVLCGAFAAVEALALPIRSARVAVYHELNCPVNAHSEWTIVIPGACQAGWVRQRFCCKAHVNFRSMNRWKPKFVLALIAIFPLGSAHSQTPNAVPESSPALIGTVTGSVYDEATGLPVRFAEINLVPIPSKPDAMPGGIQPVPADVQEQRKQVVQRVNGASGMDGSFRLGVPEGDYFVSALKPGYITPGTAEATDFFVSEDQLKSIVASLPQVHVSSGGMASVTLTLHRGAAITGRVRYADGSPVIGAMVGCVPINSVDRFEKAMRPENRDKVNSPLHQALTSLYVSQRVSEKHTTDDQGRYRIFGLSPGKYLVVTTIVMDHSPGQVTMNYGSNPYSGRLQHMFPQMIPVYAPATFRLKEAKVFEIRGDEQITDADLTIDPNGMHTLRGRVLAADDHRAPSAMIQLRQQGAKEGPRFVDLEDDGTFEINYLPSGSYTLQIISHGVADPAKRGVVPAEYKMVQLPVLIADQDVLLDEVLVVPLKPGEHNDLSLLF